MKFRAVNAIKILVGWPFGWYRPPSPRETKGKVADMSDNLIDIRSHMIEGIAAPSSAQLTPHGSRLPDHVVDGIEFYFNHGVFIPIVQDIFSDDIAESVRMGRYEASEVSELDALIQPGEIILEIGAGCGFISTYCAKNIHTKRVVCVEANPSLIGVIKLTHRVNGVEVELHNEILSKDDGEADFFIHRDFWASGTHSFLGTRIRVPATSFQRRLDEVRPTMLVVDIEGGEQALFRDVNLTGVKKIMLELHQPTIGRHGMKEVFDRLSAQGFHYETYHSTRSIVTFSHVDRV